MTITFKELREIKDSLPNGSIQRIAEKLDLSVETVRNYFGGRNFEKGQSVGIHVESGPDGGVVQLDDVRIYEMAQRILDNNVPAGQA